MKISPLTATLLAAAVLAPSAGADGLPVISIDAGGSGIAGRHVRYVALPVAEGTFLERIDQGSGRVLASRVLRGSFTIPVVANDGSAEGLSANGRTLVLISPRAAFPRETTTFRLINPARLTVRKRITLRGDYSFDAISPDGRWMYLIHYTSARDPLKYEVRAFDLVRARLDPKPIVDPREPDEAMNGYPQTRTTSADGRWAYTLYAGDEHPFVHALDTVARDARCIDLDWLAGRDDLWALRFVLGSNGRDLTLRTQDGKSIARVDTQTFEASIPVAGSRTWWTWVLALAGGLLVVALLGYGVSMRRRAAATSLGGATSA